jgi:hypothetical protein
LQLLSEVGAFSAAALLIGHLGAVPLAAHQIAISCAALAFMVPLGLSLALAVRTGQAVGAGRRDAGSAAFQAGGARAARAATNALGDAVRAFDKLRSLAPGAPVLSAHIVVNEEAVAPIVRRRLEDRLRTVLHFEHLTIQVEQNGEMCRCCPTDEVPRPEAAR